MSQAAVDRALRGGAIPFVATLLSGDTHPFVAVNLLRKAYPGMNPQEYGSVYQLGKSAYYSAQSVTGQGSSGMADVASIPINPDLFGGEFTGNQFRFETIVEYMLPHDNVVRFATININSPYNLSQSELDDYVEQQYRQLLVRDTKNVGGQVLQQALVQSVTVKTIERQF